ncbi:MAG TPA: hypothetical protein VFW05_08160 [Verrucomicrobiae bacterium]|nr:hypothetical protein [Verrucomicrobiae bacterium]
MKIFFDHERLNAYQEALKFAAWSEAVLDKTPRSSAVYGQLRQIENNGSPGAIHRTGRTGKRIRIKSYD